MQKSQTDKVAKDIGSQEMISSNSIESGDENQI